MIPYELPYNVVPRSTRPEKGTKEYLLCGGDIGISQNQVCVDVLGALEYGLGFGFRVIVYWDYVAGPSFFLRKLPYRVYDSPLYVEFLTWYWDAIPNIPYHLCI